MVDSRSFRVVKLHVNKYLVLHPPIVIATTSSMRSSRSSNDTRKKNQPKAKPKMKPKAKGPTGSKEASASAQSGKARKRGEAVGDNETTSSSGDDTQHRKRKKTVSSSEEDPPAQRRKGKARGQSVSDGSDTDPPRALGKQKAKAVVEVVEDEGDGAEVEPRACDDGPEEEENEVSHLGFDD